MSDDGDLARYEHFAWEYPLVNPLRREEVDWHALWAGRTGGPLLGLACGTGRLLCELARAGYDATGLDLSKAMLAQARGFIDGLPPDAQPRVRLVQADMADFRLAERFGLIFLADNSFRHLTTHDAMLACLRHCREHLAPGGVLLVTERRFDPRHYPGNRRAWDWSQPRTHPETGEQVRRRIEVEVSPDHRRIRGRMIYETQARDGSADVQEFSFESPVLREAEYVRLFADAGFATKVFADYRGSPPNGDAGLYCFVCRRA